MNSTHKTCEQRCFYHRITPLILLPSDVIYHGVNEPLTVLDLKGLINVITDEQQDSAYTLCRLDV